MPILRYFAAAAEAAGTEQEHVNGVDVGAVLAAASTAHGPRLSYVLEHSSLILQGRYVRDIATPLADGDVLEVLPPFAGG